MCLFEDEVENAVILTAFHPMIVLIMKLKRVVAELVLSPTTVAGEAGPGLQKPEPEAIPHSHPE